MGTLFHAFRDGGWPNLIIVFLGLLGFALGVASVLVAALGSQARRLVGALAVGMAIAILGMGAMGVMLGHRATDRALAGAGISAVQAERIQREGYLESKSCAELGLGAALVPLLGGAVALLSLRRRGLPLAGTMLGIALLVAAGDAALVAQKLPGRDYAMGDPIWQFLEAQEDIEAGRLQQGCTQLESTIGSQGEGGTVGDPSRLPDFGRLAGVCVDRRIAEAEGDGSLEALDALLAAAKPEMIDGAHRKRIEDDRARIAAAAAEGR